MLKRLLVFFCLCVSAALAFGQGAPGPSNYPFSGLFQAGAPSGNCPGLNVLDMNTSNGAVYSCPTAGGSWVAVAGSGTFTAGGDLSGTSTSQNVIGLHFGTTAFTLSSATPPSSSLPCLGYLNSTTLGGITCGTGGSGANTALSNLVTVSINTSLLAQTGVDLGSTANPFRNLYLFGAGTYGTNYFKITGTPTSTDVFTLPDTPSDTFVMLALAQSLTNKTLDGVSPTTMGYLDATSSIQTQLNAKAPLASPSFTGTVNFTGATLVKMRVGAGLTTSTNGDIGYDTTNLNWHAWQNGADSYLFGGPVSGTYTNGDCVKFAVASNVITLVDVGAACGSGGSSGGSQYGIQYNSNGSGGFGGITPPTTNCLYNINYNVTASAAVAPTAGCPGFSGRAVTGTTSTDTILYSDNLLPVDYQGSVAVAVTLPTATTLANTKFATELVNNTSGSSTALTVTPTTWTINGSATLVVAQGQSCKIKADPSGTNWDADCHDLPMVAGMNITITRGQYGPTISASGSGGTTTIASGTAALGTSSISSGACATVVTVTATGVASTDAIAWTPNASIKAVTGYAPSTSGGLSIAAYPTSGNVNFDVCNWSSGSITPGAVTLNWRVTR
jgi:hypothetical protein